MRDPHSINELTLNEPAIKTNSKRNGFRYYSCHTDCFTISSSFRSHRLTSEPGSNLHVRILWCERIIKVYHKFLSNDVQRNVHIAFVKCEQNPGRDFLRFVAKHKGWHESQYNFILTVYKYLDVNCTSSTISSSSTMMGPSVRRTLQTK